MLLKEMGKRNRFWGENIMTAALDMFALFSCLQLF